MFSGIGQSKLPAIDKRTRLIILTVIGVLILVSGVVLGLGYHSSTTAEEDITLLGYTHQTELDYRVYLLQNDLYETPTIGADETIFAKLVDQSEAALHYHLWCDQEAVINGTYSIAATIDASTWKKSLVLVPATPFSTEGQSCRVDYTHRLDPDLSKINGIVDDITSQTGVSVRDVNVVITATVNTNISIEGHGEASTSSATMTLPLGQSSYKVTITNPDTQNGQVTVTDTVEQTSVHDQRRYSLVALIVLLGLLVPVGFLPTRVYTENLVAVIQKRHRDNQKKYKDRFVAVTEVGQRTKPSTTVLTSSLEGLATIADELGVPVLFTEPFDPKESPVYVYYVLDGSVCYQWVLSAALFGLARDGGE